MGRNHEPISSKWSIEIRLDSCPAIKYGCSLLSLKPVTVSTSMLHVCVYAKLLTRFACLFFSIFCILQCCDVYFINSSKYIV